MTTFTGHIVGGAIASAASNRPAWFATVGDWLPVGEAWNVSAGAINGAWTNEQPTAEAGLTFGGDVAPGVSDVFYHRILVEPVFFDFGFLLNEQERAVKVFNGYLNAVEMVDLEKANFDAGMFLGGPDAPDTYLPLEEKTYTITVTMAGLPYLDAALVLTFDEGSSPRVVLVGTRINPFAFRPQSEVTEVLEWLTDVQEAQEGSEVRESVRIAPREKYYAEYFARDDLDRMALKAMVMGAQMRYFGLGVWIEARRIGAVAAGAEWIEVDTRWASYRDGGYAMLRGGDWREAEIVTILEVQAGGLTLSAPVKASFDAPYIMPLRIARIEGTPGYEERASHLAYAVGFAVDDNEPVTSEPSAVQYKGFDTLLAPYWVSGQIAKRRIIRPAEMIDGETGRVMVDPHGEWGRLAAEEARFAPRTRQATWELRRWLQRRAGRMRPVWVPSFQRDVRLREPFGAGDVVLTIEHMSYTHMLFDNPQYRHLAFFRNSGEILLREIIDCAVSAEGDHEYITINDGLGFGGTAADFRAVSFLSLCRLAADRVEIAWPRVGACRTAVGLVGLDHGNES